jgi:hypothetical protein
MPAITGVTTTLGKFVRSKVLPALETVFFKTLGMMTAARIFAEAYILNQVFTFNTLSRI